MVTSLCFTLLVPFLLHGAPGILWSYYLNSFTSKPQQSVPDVYSLCSLSPCFPLILPIQSLQVFYPYHHISISISSQQLTVHYAIIILSYDNHRIVIKFATPKKSWREKEAKYKIHKYKKNKILSTIVQKCRNSKNYQSTDYVN